MLMAGLLAMTFADTSAAEDGWSLSKLVPFKKSSTDARTRASVSDEDRSSGLPKLSLPSWSSKSRSASRSKQPSTWAKLNRNTQEFFGKSKDVLMPWTKDSKAKTRPVSTKKKPKTPWYKALLPQQEPEKKPSTVSEFIGQERPEI